MKPQSVLNRILPYITDIDNECRLYPVINHDGYGDIQHINKEGKKKHYLAHRLSYEIYNNVELTSDQIVLHSCDIPNCVNPNHLKIGTHEDNVQDKVNKDRQAKGVKNGRSKLTESDVINIRESDKSNKELGILYGVNRRTIYSIKKNITWVI